MAPFITNFRSNIRQVRRNLRHRIYPDLSESRSRQPQTSQPTTTQNISSQPTTSRPAHPQRSTSQPTISQPTTSQATAPQPTVSQPTSAPFPPTTRNSIAIACRMLDHKDHISNNETVRKELENYFRDHHEFPTPPDIYRVESVDTAKEHTESFKEAAEFWRFVSCMRTHGWNASICMRWTVEYWWTKRLLEVTEAA